MSSRQVWVIAQVVANILGHVVQQCVLNQSQGYWLLYDALYNLIGMPNVGGLLHTLF